MPIDISVNIHRFVEGRTQCSREASYDYCFNYFQSFRGDPQGLTGDIQQSCLHLSFYLSSWGMYRGSAPISKKSMKVFQPLIEAIAKPDNVFSDIWDIDVPGYNDANINQLICCRDRIVSLLDGAVAQEPDILVTKIMLGIFGNVPALDRYFKAGFRTYQNAEVEQLNTRTLKRTLEKIKTFYDGNIATFNDINIPTLTFNGANGTLAYTKAKLIDMVFWIEGYNNEP